MRIKDPAQLGEVFNTLGSNLNPVFTQLSRTRRVIFVEGWNFQIFAKFARRLGFHDLGNRATFTVIPITGINPDRVRSLKDGIESTLGGSVKTAVILNRDYRSDGECESIRRQCEKFCNLAIILACKEIENHLLVPSAIDRAARKRVEERVRRTGERKEYSGGCAGKLEAIVEEEKSYVMSQYIAARRQYSRNSETREGDAGVTQSAVEEFDLKWAKGLKARVVLVPGKQALSKINKWLQEDFGVTVTISQIVDGMHLEEVSTEMRGILKSLSQFATK